MSPRVSQASRVGPRKAAKHLVLATAMAASTFNAGCALIPLLAQVLGATKGAAVGGATAAAIPPKGATQNPAAAPRPGAPVASASAIPAASSRSTRSGTRVAPAKASGRAAAPDPVSEVIRLNGERLANLDAAIRSGDTSPATLDWIDKNQRDIQGMMDWVDRETGLPTQDRSGGRGAGDSAGADSAPVEVIEA